MMGGQAVANAFMALIVLVYAAALYVAHVRHKKEPEHTNQFIIKTTFLMSGFLISAVWLLDRMGMHTFSDDFIAIGGVFVFFFGGLTFLLLDILGARRER